MTVTDAQLREMLARAKKATPGPWTLCPMQLYIFGGDGHMVMDRLTEGGALRMRGVGAEVSGQRAEGEIARNAALVCSMRTDLPAVAQELLDLRAKLREWVEHTREAADNNHKCDNSDFANAYEIDADEIEALLGEGSAQLKKLAVTT